MTIGDNGDYVGVPVKSEYATVSGFRVHLTYIPFMPSAAFSRFSCSLRILEPLDSPSGSDLDATRRQGLGLVGFRGQGLGRQDDRA